MANLEKFKQTIGGGIRPNQFVVRIEPPIALNLGTVLNTAEYLGLASTLPGSSIGQAQAFHRGRMIPLAGERQFNPWSITFYADQQMAIRTVFERWSNAINNYSDNTGITNPGSYKGSGRIYLMQRNDVIDNQAEYEAQALKKYIVKGIFPIDISEIQVAWQLNDQLMEFSVTFAVESVDPVV